MSAAVDERAFARSWLVRLEDLSARIRTAARAAMRAALAEGNFERVARPVAEGAGDTSFGLDIATETVLDEWLEEAAAAGPISLMSEHAGWRHLGPDGVGGVRTLSGFDHGGPRIGIDPVDGTRNLMNDLRSAWTVVSFAGPGAGKPRFGELSYGLVAEIPDARASAYRTFAAIRGEGCTVREGELEGQGVQREARLIADADDRADHGYFPFFAYSPGLRPAVSTLAARFFERLAAYENAALESCYDDQYISSGGQLALTALGTYRMVVDARTLVAARGGGTTTTAKPYDMAGAALCAQEAGCVVTDPCGAPLDFPLDTSTPVDFVGYANQATARRLQPHLSAVLAQP